MQTMFNALPGQVDTTARYDLQGVVTKKYAPKYGQQSFFCQVAGKTVFFHESHYGKFDVLDMIGVQAAFPFRRLENAISVTQGDTVIVLYRYQPEVEVRTVEFGYVSDPKKIWNDHWYLAKTEDGWYRVPYSVASQYWLGDEDLGGDVPDYYKLLGVSKDAIEADIHRAWKETIRRNHPDLFPPSRREAQTELAARINAARDCLTDPDERGRYDAQLSLAAGQSLEPAKEVRAWPGRGFGLLKAKIEVRGDSFKVVEILSWTNQEVHFEGVIVLRRLRCWDTGLVIEVSSGDSMYQQVETCVVPWSVVGRRQVEILGKEGVLEYKIDAIRTGRWDWQNSKVVPGLRVRDAELKWPF